jgi:hypothetical protein
MASKPFNKPKSFSELVDQSRADIPKCPDLRFSIRQRLSQAPKPEAPPLGWMDIILQWGSIGRVKAGFGMAFTALMLTSYMELTRPEPQQRPSGPPMRIMQQLGN